MPGTQSSVRKPRLHQLDSMGLFLRDHMKLYGYQPIDLPIIEDADLFLIKAGDHIIRKLFTFERHGQQLALRPEFTAAAAYRYINESRTEAVRWQFSGPIFEYETEDAHNYQHASIGAELIGKSGAIADAEIIEMSAKGIASQGIKDWKICIGHTGLVRKLLAHFQLDSRTQHLLLRHLADISDPSRGKAYILNEIRKSSLPSQDADEDSCANPSAEIPGWSQILDTVPTGLAMGGRTREDIARRLFEKRQRTASFQQIVAALDMLEQLSRLNGPADLVLHDLAKQIVTENLVFQEDLRYLSEVIDLLHAANIPEAHILIQPALARSWEYYTGIVFELRCNGDLVGGGGRYDELSRLIGGTGEIPAVGFAYYPETLAAALPVVTEESITYTLRIDPESLANSVRWASLLRENQIPLVLREQAQVDETTVLDLKKDNTIQFLDETYTVDDADRLIIRLARER